LLFGLAPFKTGSAPRADDAMYGHAAGIDVLVTEP
jgi:hypothetical protein